VDPPRHRGRRPTPCCARVQDRARAAGLPSDLETQEIVNFIRDLWANRCPSTRRRRTRRGHRYSVLGDIFHSQPVTLNPPNNPMFFYDYGFVQPARRAHDYQLYMNEHARRRRVALAGANDGMLHASTRAFMTATTGGPTTTPARPRHGTELFAFVRGR